MASSAISSRINMVQKGKLVWMDGWIRLFWSHNNMYILTYLTAQLFPSTHCTTWDKHTCYSLQLWECKRPWSQFVANSKRNTKYSGHTIYKSKNRGQNVL